MTTETILTDERLIEMAANELQEHFDRLPNSIFLFARAIEQAVLQSPEIQELRRDAARYRWLRDGGNDDIGVVMGFDCIDAGPTAVVGTYGEGLDGEHLDDAIDAAMEQQK